MGFKEWWGSQLSWLKWLISGGVLFTMSLLGALTPTLLHQFYRVAGIQGVVVVFAITVPLLIAVMLAVKYILDKLGEKLDYIIGILLRIAAKMGVNIGEGVQSPGYVYATCRWLRISKEEIRDSIRHIYVYCAHPEKPITINGCPSNCLYLDPSDKPTGSGAFAGLVLGGLGGLILGGGPLGGHNWRSAWRICRKCYGGN